MAPLSFPEEVDVFSIPHSRMKELVNKYLEMLTETNFDDAFRMTSLLENLSTTFKEFKAHEQIENRCILRKLKRKLRALSITNTAVCNCHKDNQLTEMMSLFRDGYRCTRKTAADRINYGIKLRRALEQFTDQFIPHMKEEEEVFQPLLMQYFTYEELCELKALVLQEHWRTLAEEGESKLVEDSLSSESSCDEEESSDKGHYSPFDLLPDELLLKIFSTLSPRDLGICACVNKRSNQLATDPELWTDIFPVQWAKGNWTFSPRPEPEEEPMSQKEFSSAVLDEDADVDESMDGESNESDAFFEQLKDEARLLSGLTKHLLPKVGSGVKTINLANSVGLTNGTLYKMLVQCPNVEDLDLTQTRVSDVAFKGLGRNGCGLKLQHVNLSGCEKVTDLTLQRLTRAIRQPQGSPGANSPSDLNSLQQPNSNNDDTQSVESEKSQKTLRNDKCVRTKHSCDTDNNSQNTSSTPECFVRTNNSGCVFNKTDKSHNSVVPAEGLEQCVPKSCRQLLAGIQQLERSFSELTFCPCPLARRKFTENSESLATNDEFSSTEGCDLIEPSQQCKKAALFCDGMKEDCVQDCSPVCDNSKGVSNASLKAASSLVNPSLLSLNLSGCWLVTDDGLRLLASHGGLPALTQLDLSGCLSITAEGLAELVEACPNLDHAHLYYCDNLEDDPYPATASGCQNLACNSRVCCRSGN